MSYGQTSTNAIRVLGPWKEYPHSSCTITQRLSINGDVIVTIMKSKRGTTNRFQIGVWNRAIKSYIVRAYRSMSRAKREADKLAVEFGYLLASERLLCMA